MKITDFGIAHAAASALGTRGETLIATAAYLAPERVDGAPATPASDLYSLGIVAWESLAGGPPFPGFGVEAALAHRDRPLPPLPADVPGHVPRHPARDIWGARAAPAGRRRAPGITVGPILLG